MISLIDELERAVLSWLNAEANGVELPPTEDLRARVAAVLDAPAHLPSCPRSLMAAPYKMEAEECGPCTCYQDRAAMPLATIQLLVEALAGYAPERTNCLKRENKDGTLNQGPTCLSRVLAEYTPPEQHCRVCRAQLALRLAEERHGIRAGE